MSELVVREMAESGGPAGGVPSRARAHDFGAQVVSCALRGEPVLWLSREAVLDGSAAIRGGVPICFPWFGPGPHGDLSPNHGVARTATWRPVSPDAEEAFAWELTSEEVAEAPGAEHLPGPFRARYAVRLGETLDLDLSVTNTGEVAWSFEAALHSYLHVGDVRKVAVLGLEDAEYLDKTTGTRQVQRGEVHLSGETDRVYDRSDVAVVDDPTLERQIVVSPRGATQTVVWNPWVEAAARAKDIGDDEWRDFVCVETAATGDLALTVEPGSTVGIGCTISVRQAGLGATLAPDHQEGA